MFDDRADAGRQLAQKLAHYRGRDALVLALPRGGVVTGYEIARALNLPLDIVAIRKVGHPDSPEYAVCAVDERGTTLCSDVEVATIDRAWLAAETKRQQREAKRRAALYRSGRAPRALKNKIVILADDGVATGLTMRLAIKVVKEQKPKKIVVAVPVAAEDTARTISKEADALVVLEDPRQFLGAVGAHYLRFDQTTDGEVIKLLHSAQQESNLRPTA